MKKNRYHAFDVINILLIGLFCLCILIPIMFVISRSFMSQEDITKYGYTLLPKSINLSAYNYLLTQNTAMPHAFLVSLQVTALGTVFNLLVSALFAYGLSKKDLPMRKFFTMMLFITMIFNGGLIPRYLLVSGIGLLDTLWALILPGLMNAWNTLILRNFFQEIPESLLESAYLDGATEMRAFRSIVIPLSKAALATVGLFYAVKHWNAWFDASIFISTKSKWPMQLLLKQMLDSLKSLADSGGYESMIVTLPTESVKAAAIVITALPIIIVYPFIQKYFAKGVMVGSVKG